MKNALLQKKFLKKLIQEDIEESKIKNDGSLDKDDYRKIELYGFAVPAMIGEAFCTLRNEKMTVNERICLSYMAVNTGLFDDLFDKKELSVEYIDNLLKKSQHLTGTNSHEQLLLRFYKKSLEFAEKPSEIIDCADLVFKSQILSRNQTQKGITQGEISDITFQKGGYSMLLYSQAFKNDINENVKKIIYKLGGIGQLENDIFDIFKDYQEGIKTLATEMKNVNQLRKSYLELMREIFNLVDITNYQTSAKAKFRQIISLVMSRALVCLDCIEKNEKLTNNQFKIKEYDRNQLICNMESLKSVIKLFHISAKYNALF